MKQQTVQGFQRLDDDSSSAFLLVAELSGCTVRLAKVGERLQQPVSEPLMVSFAVVVASRWPARRSKASSGL
jgi:hypothetical protein